jgi:hypothetical protein
MLTIKIPASEYFDESSGKFIMIKECIINLEHSLISLSRWESKWHRPFLGKEPFTNAQYRDYVACMSLNPIDPMVLLGLTEKNMEEIKEYIDAPMTATTFPKTNNNKPNKEVITAELLYYRMIAFNIPMECQKWHFNRLLTLIRVCDIKSQPSKKKGNQSTALSKNAQINAARRAKYNTKG